MDLSDTEEDQDGKLTNAQNVKKSFTHPRDLMDTLKLLIQGVEHRGNAQINEAHDFLINKF